MTSTTLAGLLLVLVSVVCGDEGVTRQLNVTREWVTSCRDQLKDDDKCNAYPLAHVVATSQQDTLHVLISLWAAPSCLLLRTPLDAQLNINWALLLSDNQTGAIKADRVLAAYGVSVDQLIEFDDPNDTADLSHANANATVLHPLSLDMDPASRQLDVEIVLREDGYSQVITVRAPPLNTTNTNWSAVGNVTFKVEMLDSNRRTDELPHLQQTGNSIVAGVVLDKLETNSGFKHSRFGVQMTTVGNETQQLKETKSLDDEFTPGVFKLVGLSSSAAAAGYLQWRPVAYTDSEYTIEHSTTARHYGVSLANATSASPLLRAYFGELALTHRFNVTFGLSEDGWYKDAKYAAWELTMGLGALPTDQFSLTVILLLSIGLGLPTAALIGGGVWIIVRRVRGQTGGNVSLLTEED